MWPWLFQVNHRLYLKNKEISILNRTITAITFFRSPPSHRYLVGLMGQGDICYTIILINDAYFPWGTMSYWVWWDNSWWGNYLSIPTRLLNLLKVTGLYYHLTAGAQVIICMINIWDVPVEHDDVMAYKYYLSLQWRHNERDGVSNHQPRDCLLNRLFWHRWKNVKTPRHWPLWGEFTGDRWIPRTKGQ